MISIFPKNKSQSEIIMAELTPVDIVPKFDEDTASGRDFNIILLVKEQAPRRIKEINKQVEHMLESAARLTAEKDQLEKLLAALSP
jgi:hypothetical protein